ncbi:hypothetical protein [Nocardia sp. NBC_01009]|uniref:hypothetical protein n=1 Tax=Nocardia sp. NBC_01009 TaxID=2975996 RepID=UPI00386CD64B|nr:hypothetical protein OHA42_13045 [Nocardia sp. NBC_01009]
MSIAKHFEEKLVDFVGLYPDPPENAIVLWAQADRQGVAARGVPLRPGADHLDPGTHRRPQ